MGCVICLLGKNRPAVCPPLRPLCVSLTLSFYHPPPLILATVATACVLSVHFSMCLFVCLCLLRNSWMWFVVLNQTMGIVIAVKTHTDREHKREVLAPYFAL